MAEHAQQGAHKRRLRITVIDADIETRDIGWRLAATLVGGEQSESKRALVVEAYRFSISTGSIDPAGSKPRILP